MLTEMDITSTHVRWPGHGCCWECLECEWHHAMGSPKATRAGMPMKHFNKMLCPGLVLCNARL